MQQNLELEEVNMPEEDRNVRPTGPTGPTRPTGITRPAPPRGMDTSGLIETDRGWYDPVSQAYLSPSHSRARAANAELEEQRRQQAQQDFQCRQTTLPMLRDELRAAQEEGNRQRQAQIIQQNYPEVARQLSGIISSIQETVPQDIRGTELEAEYIRNELGQDADFMILDSLHRGYQAFISNPDNAGLFDPRLLTQFRAAGSGDTTGAFADNIQIDDQGRAVLPEVGGASVGAPLNIQNLSSPEELQEARGSLRELQDRLPQGMPEERRGFAEETFVVHDDGSETSLADMILNQNQLVQELEQRQPQGLTMEQLQQRGIIPNSRDFNRLPDGTFQPRSFSGVPSLAVMRGLEENAAPPPTIRYQGEIVPDNERFGVQPEGTLRQAIGGVPGFTGQPGGTMVSDIPIDPDAPRYGIYQNRDGTFTGLGRDGNQGGFATAEEAIEWSRLHLPPPQDQREAGGQQVAEATPEVSPEPTPAAAAPPTFAQSFTEGGLFGQGGIVNPTEEIG